MKLKKYFSILWAGIFVCTTGVFGGAAEKAPELPVARIVENQYVFDSVLEGVEVVHDFVIQNEGSGLLKIKKVKTD